jgi:hypothetical protein
MILTNRSASRPAALAERSAFAIGSPLRRPRLGEPVPQERGEPGFLTNSTPETAPP